MTPSTSTAPRPVRAAISETTVAPRSDAGVSLSVPPNVPIAVRRGVEMTISSPLNPIILSLEVQAAVDADDLAGDVRTLRDEEAHDLRNLLGCPEAAQRD